MPIMIATPGEDPLDDLVEEQLVKRRNGWPKSPSCRLPVKPTMSIGFLKS